ncbi:NUDIX-domain-containing protein [Aspergillus uvarum CBS 121591]|uniref:NUDIX-domain-containing protein n=1 Tax=Aspergillus uvarum CBS 121591 TaxID=1448315 RepID=A0A319CKK5_9EURO|nr:NUDIX-domain-containing protein [Aspergillus uvarum CBS 121591]PYH84421.1 NUDIX-domain-containing protein [Aspergillus uvarum CBS 121591]
MPPPPTTNTFTHPPALDPYTLPLPTFLTTPHTHTHTLTPTTHIVTGALIFNPNPSTTTTKLPNHPPEKQHILLLRRAPTDSYPGRWEAPGGSCDATDASILAGAAREVYEETGLRVVRFLALVGVDAWEVVRADGVRRVVKFTFLVDVDLGLSMGVQGVQGMQEEVEREVEGVVKSGGLGIRLEPAEHDAFVWATEEEVRAGVVCLRGQRVGMEFVGRQRENYLRGFEAVRSLEGWK